MMTQCEQEFSKLMVENGWKVTKIDLGAKRKYMFNFNGLTINKNEQEEIYEFLKELIQKIGGKGFPDFFVYQSNWQQDGGFVEVKGPTHKFSSEQLAKLNLISEILGFWCFIVKYKRKTKNEVKRW